MKAFYLKFFDFNNWANNMIAEFLRENNIEDEEVIRVMSHIVNAQRNWYYRVLHAQNDVPVWNNISPDAISERITENGRLWVQFIKNQDEENLREILHYQNMAGEPKLNTLGDVLTHLVNHSSYHRGQVIYLIRALGIAPPGTDYIKYAELLQ